MRRGGEKGTAGLRWFVGVRMSYRFRSIVDLILRSAASSAYANTRQSDQRLCNVNDVKPPSTAIGETIKGRSTRQAYKPVC
jgi:hypothetical protein